MGRSGGTTRLAYQPALDGVRAVAVTMVLLFHGGVGWMRGGYFGVSVFFTLSGYLITSLLVREYDATARVSPGAFYVRRAKRLLPASTVCLAAASILATRDVWRGADHLRRVRVRVLPDRPSQRERPTTAAHVAVVGQTSTIHPGLYDR